MNTISTWSPLDLILPTVDANSDSAVYFVTDSGSIDGLDISFNAGDWLVYIKKDGVGNWYKTSGGITVFNSDTSQNAPDPGFYTKVRLDNNGQIIDASYIDSDDLPKHTHDVKDITGDLDLRIQSIVGAMFQQHHDSSVKFKYDNVTHTISAEVNIDDVTITRGDFGELVAQGGGDGSQGGGSTASNFTGTITLEQVEDLSDRLLAIESQIQKNFVVCNGNSGLVAKYTDEATYLAVKFDGTSLVLNSDGELSVSSNILMGGSPDGSDTACGSHIHSVSQITDFEEEVKKLVQNNAKFNVSEIPLDSSTIIVNSKGELSCIAAGLKPHKHSVADISDLPPFVLTEAPNQVLEGEFTSGYINLTGKTIGEAIDTLNRAILEMKSTVDRVDGLVNNANPPEPDRLPNILFSRSYINEKTVVALDTLKRTTAGSGVRITSDYFYPANEGIIRVIVDGKQVYEKQLDETTGSFVNDGETFVKYTDGNFSIVDVRDSYVGVSLYLGFFKSQKIEYTVTGLEEGYHTMYFEHVVNDKVYTSKELPFSTYEVTSPVISFINLTQPSNDTYISGIKCYNGDGKITFKPVVENAYKYCFIPDYSFKYNFNNLEDVVLDPESYTNGKLFYPSQTLFIEKGRSGSSYLRGVAYNILGNKSVSSVNFNTLLWNSTDIEQYRVQYTQDYGDVHTQVPEVISSKAFEEYKPINPVQSYELVVFDNIGKLVKADYTLTNGANYISHTSDRNGFAWINLRFPCPYISNLHLDVRHADGTPFARLMNGSLEGIEIFASVSSTDTPGVWVNGNSPYSGYGSASGLNYSGLDLFKSTDGERYLTWGQKPDIDEGFLYIKIGTRSDIDLGRIVESVKESIDEWS